MKYRIEYLTLLDCQQSSWYGDLSVIRTSIHPSSVSQLSLNLLRGFLIISIVDCPGPYAQLCFELNKNVFLLFAPIFFNFALFCTWGHMEAKKKSKCYSRRLLLKFLKSLLNFRHLVLENVLGFESWVFDFPHFFPFYKHLTLWEEKHQNPAQPSNSFWICQYFSWLFFWLALTKLSFCIFEIYVYDFSYFFPFLLTWEPVGKKRFKRIFLPQMKFSKHLNFLFSEILSFRILTIFFRKFCFHHWVI